MVRAKMGNGDCDNMMCVKSEEKSEQNEVDGMNTCTTRSSPVVTIALD